jgi:hypothetical protein
VILFITDSIAMIFLYNKLVFIVKIQAPVCFSTWRKNSWANTRVYGLLFGIWARDELAQSFVGALLQSAFY